MLDTEKIDIILETITLLEKLFFVIPPEQTKVKAGVLNASAYLLDFTMIIPQVLPKFRMDCENLGQVQALVANKMHIKLVTTKAPNMNKRPVMGIPLIDDTVLKISKLVTNNSNNPQLTLKNIQTNLAELTQHLTE